MLVHAGFYVSCFWFCWFLLLFFEHPPPNRKAEKTSRKTKMSCMDYPAYPDRIVCFFLFLFVFCFPRIFGNSGLGRENLTKLTDYNERKCKGIKLFLKQVCWKRKCTSGNKGTHAKKMFKNKTCKTQRSTSKAWSPEFWGSIITFRTSFWSNSWQWFPCKHAVYRSNIFGILEIKVLSCLRFSCEQSFEQIECERLY